MYLYLRACGGFNDILCGIMEMLAYCKKYNRTLLVGGAPSAYKVNFADYFDFTEDDVICDEKRITEICNTIDTVYPGPLKESVLDLINGRFPIQYLMNAGAAAGARTRYAYGYSGGTFDLPSSKRTEQLLVYVRSGGGNGYAIFKQLSFSPDIKMECKRRYDQLEKPYIALHIRNTDSKCDYASLYRANQEEIKSFKDIYIATDDKDTIEFFRGEGLNVKNFTTFPTARYNSLHKCAIDPQTKMTDLLCDIYIIAMSSKLLSNSKGGFIKLIRTCHANKAEVEEQFVYESDKIDGLEDTISSLT